MTKLSSIQPWKLLSSTTALDEKWFPVRKDAVQLPTGKVVDDYFVWESPHIVSIVAVTPDEKLVLVQQYRHAVGKVLYQFPAGAVDAGETAEAAAHRELLEETGFTCRKLVHLATLSPYATKMSGLDDAFIALDVTPVGDPKYDEQEESLVSVMGVDEVLTLIATQEVMMTQLPAHLLLALRYLKRL
jgi:8-oxo-dGTP pyrophosphatase MutT (NUDIX family)